MLFKAFSVQFCVAGVLMLGINSLRPGEAFASVRHTIIGSNNGLPPVRLQTIFWTNAEILLFQTLGTNIGEIQTQIRRFSFNKMQLRILSAKWRTFCLGHNVLSNVLNHNILHVSIQATMYRVFVWQQAKKWVDRFACDCIASYIGTMVAVYDVYLWLMNLIYWVNRKKTMSWVSYQT